MLIWLFQIRHQNSNTAHKVGFIAPTVRHHIQQTPLSVFGCCTIFGVVGFAWCISKLVFIDINFQRSNSYKKRYVLTEYLLLDTVQQKHKGFNLNITCLMQHEAIGNLKLSQDLPMLNVWHQSVISSWGLETKYTN